MAYYRDTTFAYGNTHWRCELEATMTRQDIDRERSRAQLERNRKMLRIARARNGYSVTDGDCPDPSVYFNRADVHRHVDKFFDALENGENAPSQRRFKAPL